MWTRLVTALALFAATPVATAIESGSHVEDFEIYLNNEASLQRGAKYFVNHCLSCHSARYMRYSRLAEDLGLTADQVEKNLIFTGQKIGETMTNAMRSEDAKRWFGNAPPDLTLVARSRGVDWLYSYLRSFYLDPARPFGVNNLVYPNVNMPHVLAQLQGGQRPVYEDDDRGGEEKVIDHLELVQPGLMTSEEYDRMVRDLVTFMAYMAEPARLARLRVGMWVMLFLIVLLVLSYLLKKEYWKDVH